MIYVHTHLGLGDALICNGLVRSLLARWSDDFVIYCKFPNVKTVKFMYHDIPRISIHGVKDDVDAFKHDRVRYSHYLQIGFNNINAYGHVPWDSTFYKQMGVPFENKYEKWYYKNDNLKEQADLYNHYGLKNDDNYIFVHDEASNEFVGGEGKIRDEYLKGKKVIRPIRGLTDNIFDYVAIIRCAKEIHCIDSAFLHLIDHVHTFNTPAYFHKYARTNVKTIYDPIAYMDPRWKWIE